MFLPNAKQMGLVYCLCGQGVRDGVVSDMGVRYVSGKCKITHTGPGQDVSGTVSARSDGTTPREAQGSDGECSEGSASQFHSSIMVGDT